MPSVFDRLPIVNLDHFDEFREKYFNHLYLCSACRRSFDTIKAIDSCKFCNSPNLTEMRSVERAKGIGKQPSFRYFCPTCEKNFRSAGKLNVCPGCRTEYLHVYTWDTLRRRDRIYIKMAKAFHNVFGKRAEKRLAAQANLPETSSKKAWASKIKFSRNDGEELPTY